MLINREDIVFATCNQLASLISEDWENQTKEVSEALACLRLFDEPGELHIGPDFITNPIRMMPLDREPESIRIANLLMTYKSITNNLKVVMKHSDGWETENSDTLKKEIISRISDYEKEINRIITPVFAEVTVKL